MVFGSDSFLLEMKLYSNSGIIEPLLSFELISPKSFLSRLQLQAAEARVMMEGAAKCGELQAVGSVLASRRGFRFGSDCTEYLNRG